MPAPNTAAGRRLESLLAASLRERFIDNELSKEFLDAVPRERHVSVFESLHNDGRPILLCRIESTSDNEVVAILGGIDEHDEVEYGRFFVAVAGPDEKVSLLGIEPATREDLTRKIEPLDDAAVHRVVSDVADGLSDYVFADKATKMQDRIREATETGEYAGITDHRRLARRLTDDLRAVSGDNCRSSTARRSSRPRSRSVT